MQVYGLVGNPVGHSLSPPMHEAAYEAFERWTGRDAPVDAMNAALRSHLESD